MSGNWPQLEPPQTPINCSLPSLTPSAPTPPPSATQFTVKNMTMHVDIRDHVVSVKAPSHSLDIRLMQGHQAGMNAHTDGRQVEVVEQHRQMVMQSASRMKVQLQVARRGESETAA